MVKQSDEEEREPLGGSSSVVEALHEAPTCRTWRDHSTSWFRPIASVACVFALAVVATTARAKLRQGPVRGSRSAALLADGPIQLQEWQAEKPPPCQIFWRMTIADVIAEGWGSRILFAGTMFQRYDEWVDECHFLTSQEVADEWESWGMHVPFGIVSMDDWAGVESDQSLQSVDDSFRVSIRGPWPGEVPDGFFSNKPATLNMVFGDWAGCWSQFDHIILGMFKTLLKRPRLVKEDYIGLHIRHGDKTVEGPVSSFKSIMALAEKHHFKKVFLATDDSNVLNETQRYTDAGFNFIWTSYTRQEGGEAPDTCYGLWCHHNNKQDAIYAVLNDTMALAQASVLVGNFNSNFFRLPWILNYLRRTDEERKEDWCHDVITGKSCSKRHDFVCQFVDFAREQGVPYYLLPDKDSHSVKDCSDPFTTRRLGPDQRKSGTPSL